MGNIVSRIAAIHDISGFGRCSLTVIIPVLSSMGIQVCPVPTAVLSTHPGGFEGFSFQDLTEGMEEYLSHWKSINLEFDCIYSGFLGSKEQIDIVHSFLKDYKNKGGSLVVVDPVMGDHGKLYKIYDDDMQNKMKLLVGEADIVTPNLTEACLLLGEEYTDKPLSKDRIKYLLKSLSKIGPKMVVITGLKDDYGNHINTGYNAADDTYWGVNYEHVPVQYPGTGDIFTSVLTGGLINGDSLPIAMDRATQFLSLAVRTTYGYKTPQREGVMLEKVLGCLGNELSSLSFNSL